MKRAVILLMFLLAAPFLFAQQALVIKAPGKIPADDRRLKVFLGGTIDMGTAENWQQKVGEQLAGQEVILLNPRRDDWNRDWKPVADEPNFREQVEWELNALEASDYIIMYLIPGSQSPISLLELGLHARTGKLMVICPDGFWRKGNVDIVSEKYHINTYNNLDEVIDEIRKKAETER